MLIELRRTMTAARFRSVRWPTTPAPGRSAEEAKQVLARARQSRYKLLAAGPAEDATEPTDPEKIHPGQLGKANLSWSVSIAW
jgi:hypothetical protein